MDYAKLIALLLQLKTDLVAKAWIASASDANQIIGLILAAWLTVPPAPHAMFAAAPVTLESAMTSLDAHIEDARAVGKIDLKSLFALLVQLLPLLFAHPAA